MSELTKQRPKFLDLTKIQLPLAAKMSILHRISGGAIFLLLPCLIYLLQLSLGTPEEFETFLAITRHPVVKLIFLALTYGFVHHVCMGIRLLLIDIHKGVARDTARASAKLVLVAGLVITAILGVTLW
ncbi:Succinate dehydrogenase [Sterolibacterium denitrificans]|uniref:Succinate dehydrogenase cytochrome b556 subunit n=1 Tax=Sterolibacterium denitrificans TaxID=157592 RepID=A0A7Z7HTB2_9PROT|nr:succinate dehydrogenase, cytochrome b556 subunit [Sterolibacterium denitrificans]SMB27065.1 Succinate dehydrogenase [Sterolibacterium denitrificans]